MYCRSHPFKIAKRKCDYCHDSLCPSCQEHYGHHSFCGKHCYIKHFLNEVVTQSLVFLKSKQLYISSLIIIPVAVIIGLPKSSQPTWKGHIESIKNSKSDQPSASKMKSNPHVYKYSPFSSSELPVETTFNKIKAFNRNRAKEILHFDKNIRKKETAKKRFSDQPEISTPIPVIKNSIETKEVTKGLGKRLPLLVDIDRGRYDKKEISLTFDGGSGKKHATDIIRTLKEKGIVTTIFLSGDFIIKYPDLVLEIVEDGHEVGNHTFTHPHLTSYNDTWKHNTLPGVDKDYLREELLRTAKAYKNATARDMAPVWRAPYGEVNKEILQWGYEAGFTHVFWTRNGKRKESLDTLDWVSNKESRFYHTAEEIEEKVLNFGNEENGLNGGIIMMHLSTERNADLPHLRLGEIIDSLRKEGYRFVTVSKLIKNLKTAEPIQVASKRALLSP
jgi:peptidoglycan/xylan/chitin deacetylase (PgdA/CDA1 family)